MEVYGEPDLIDVKSLSHQLDSFSIGVSGITGMWGLSSSESRFRNLVTTNNNSLKACSELCKKMRYSLPEAGGKTFNLCLFSEEPLISDSNHKYLSREEKRKLVTSLIESLRGASKICQ